MVRDIEPAEVLFLDTETTGLDPYTARLLILSVRANGVTYVVDFTKLPIRHLLELRKALTTKRCVWHNVVFDWKIIYHQSGIEMPNLHCTYVTEQLLRAGIRGSQFSLQAVAAERLKIELDKSIRAEFIGKDDDALSQDALSYAARDVDVLEPIYAQQIQEVVNYDLTRVYELECALLPITARMEYTGILIDRGRLEAAVPVFEEAARKADRALQDVVIQNGLADTIVFTKDGYTAVNTASPKQMLELARKFGIDVQSLNKKELTEWDNKWAAQKNRALDFVFDTDDENEDSIKVSYHHPFLRRHGIRTAIDKIYGTYVLGLLERINPVTNRIHTGFKQCGAVATGRYASVDPNLQNLPQSGKLKALGLQEHDIRSMFVPSQGRKFIICDFSGIEAVILASMANDENMLDQLAHGDIHSAVAMAMFGVPVSKERAGEKLQPDLTLRNAAKTLTYAIMYGTTGWNLYRSLSAALASVGVKMRPDDGDRYIEAWHALFPKAGKALRMNADRAIVQYYVTTALGRRRQWVKEHLLASEGSRAAAGREGSNAPIQGGSADMTKLSLLLASRPGMPVSWLNFERTIGALDPRRSSLLLCVHDEIVVEADDDYVNEASHILKYCMEEAGYQLYPTARAYGLIKAEPKISTCYDK